MGAPILSGMTVDVQASLTEVIVKLSGIIDENAAFCRLPVGSKQLIFEMSGVTLLNSLGIRSWLTWMKELKNDDPHRQIVFRKCPRVLVDQMNMVRGFLPEGAIVESFHIPYFCETCESSQSFLFQRSSSYDGYVFHPATADAPLTVAEPDVPCPCCRQPMTRDISPAKYFAFLKYR